MALSAVAGRDGESAARPVDWKRLAALVPELERQFALLRTQHAGAEAMKILIAEDDFTSRSILTAILKKWGFDPVAAEDGSAAWELLQKPDAPGLSFSIGTCRAWTGWRSVAV